MADFDLVVAGNLVTAHRIVNDGFVAVSDGKIAFVGRGTPPAAREQIDARAAELAEPPARRRGRVPAPPPRRSAGDVT